MLLYQLLSQYIRGHTNLGMIVKSATNTNTESMFAQTHEQNTRLYRISIVLAILL